MKITCPSCSKANTASPCQRCGCDLETLFAVRQSAATELAAAAAALRSGDPEEAHTRAGHSWELLHTPESARVAFLACVAQDDFPSALLWRNRT